MGEATLMAMPANLLASALYDAIKLYFSRPKKAKRSAITFQYKRKPTGEIIGKLQVEIGEREISDGVLKASIATFRETIRQHPQGGNFQFNRKKKQWKKAKRGRRH